MISRHGRLPGDGPTLDLALLTARPAVASFGHARVSLGGRVRWAWSRSSSRGAFELEDYCERCGTLSAGQERWMFHHGQLPRKEFFCFRCLRVLRIYAAIALSLLGLLLTAFVVATWWLGAFG